MTMTPHDRRPLLIVLALLVPLLAVMAWWYRPRPAPPPADPTPAPAATTRPAEPLPPGTACRLALENSANIYVTQDWAPSN
jgi:hypothetical protein